MKTILSICLLLTGCGMEQRVRGGTHNEVVAGGEVAVKVILTIDLKVCEDFDFPSQKLECISAITGALDSLGDLSKVLVCDPANPQKCDILSKILDGVK